MKHWTFFLIAALFLTFFSCKKVENSKSVQIVNDSIIDDSIVTIIFNKRDFNKDTLVSKTGAKSLRLKNIHYTILGEFIERGLPKNNYNKTDTIKINTKNDVILYHAYHFYHHSYYKFKPGDTVVFDYRDDAPFCTITNRKVESDINYFVGYNLKSDVLEDENAFFLNNKRFRTEEEKKTFNLENIKYLNKKKNDLDSIYSKKIISDEYYKIYKQDYNYQLSIFQENDSILNESFLVQDQNLSLPFNRLLVIEHFNKLFPPVLIKEKFGSHYDNKKQFNLALEFENISKKNKNFLLYYFFNNLVEYSNLDDINICFEKLKTTSLDKSIIKELDEKYLINLKELKKNKEDVVLLDSKKVKTKLDAFISQNKGKVIYIDFWASWCAPCRKLMPESHKLQEEYAGKDVVFLYISIDKDYNAWQKAMEKETLPKRTSHLSVNYPESKFYRNLQLKSIPRYLLYNKNGKLINANAPSPDSKEIRIELNKYLK